VAPAGGPIRDPEVDQGRSHIENFNVFDFELSLEEIAAIDALDTGVRGGPDPDSITLETYGREISEA
jgi:diketogulonate reductase-like aldo/keto reductase